MNVLRANEYEVRFFGGILPLPTFRSKFNRVAMDSLFQFSWGHPKGELEASGKILGVRNGMH
jgi:hypothetical protein